MKVNAISLNVYKWSMGDCSNHGVSSKYNNLYYLGEWDNINKKIIPYREGYHDFELLNKSDIPENAIVLVHGFQGYKYLAPLKQLLEGKWLMMGGNFAYSCDNRFRTDVNEYPLPIHDRTEEEDMLNWD